MKAFFLECNDSFWVDVALHLSKEFGIRPVYWVAAASSEARLVDAFADNIVFHANGDAARGIPPKELSRF